MKSKKDSVREETVSATEVIVDRKYNRALLLQLRNHRLTEENLRKVLVPEEKALLEEKTESRAQNPQIKVYGPVVWLLAPSRMSKLQV